MQNIRVVKKSAEENSTYEIAITEKVITLDAVFSAAIVAMLHYPANVVICHKPFVNPKLNVGAEEAWMVHGSNVIMLLWSEKGFWIELNDDNEVAMVNNTPVESIHQIFELIHQTFHQQLKKLLKDETIKLHIERIETEEDRDKLELGIKFAMETIRAAVFTTTA